LRLLNEATSVTAQRIVNVLALLALDDAVDVQIIYKMLHINKQRLNVIATLYTTKGLQAALRNSRRLAGDAIPTKRTWGCAAKYGDAIVALYNSTPPAGMTRWTLATLLSRLRDEIGGNKLCPASVSIALRARGIHLGKACKHESTVVGRELVRGWPDKPTRWIIDELERRYGRKVSPQTISRWRRGG
jgi:hypothetical protein